MLCAVFALAQNVFSQAYFDYLFGYQIDKKYLESDKKDTETAAQRYAMLGLYPKALATYDAGLADEAAWENCYLSSRELGEADSLKMAAYELQGAIDYIVAQARKTRVVVLGQNGHQPLHHLFARKVLNALRQEGFEYLALETMGYYDTLMARRGYPVLPTGEAFREPQMGKLAREAIAIGYRPFAYDKRKLQTDARELAQAKNLQAFLEANKAAKVVMYCSAANAREAAHDTLRFKTPLGMAHHLKQLSGIDPLTIDQALLTEKSAPKFESPYYQWITNRFTIIPEPPAKDTAVLAILALDSLALDSLGIDSLTLDSLRAATEIEEVWDPEPEFLIKGPSVLSKPSGEGFSAGTGVDVCVFHPRSRLEHKRPAELLGENEGYYRLDEDMMTVSYPCMVRAYRLQEANEKLPAPVDIIFLEDENDDAALILTKGTYLIKMESDIGESDERKVTF